MRQKQSCLVHTLLGWQPIGWEPLLLQKWEWVSCRSGKQSKQRGLKRGEGEREGESLSLSPPWWHSKHEILFFSFLGLVFFAQLCQEMLSHFPTGGLKKKGKWGQGDARIYQSWHTTPLRDTKVVPNLSCDSRSLTLSLSICPWCGSPSPTWAVWTWPRSRGRSRPCCLRHPPPRPPPPCPGARWWVSRGSRSPGPRPTCTGRTGGSARGDKRVVTVVLRACESDPTRKTKLGEHHDSTRVPTRHGFSDAHLDSGCPLTLGSGRTRKKTHS